MPLVGAVQNSAYNFTFYFDYFNIMSKYLKFTDLASLSERDTTATITAWAEAAVSGTELPAALCVYPSMIESAALAIGSFPVALASVAGAFPSGQTYMEVKLLEVAMAIENGADEIDMTLDVGAILARDFDVAKAEIAAIKEEIGDDALLKVILETGVLADDQLIYDASLVAMQAGADFIKTSTGKALVAGVVVGATPSAARVMCRAIKQFYDLTGRRVGFKASGGIRTDDDAKVYYDIVNEELGEQWLTPSLFRLGRSSI